jgi:hypothetical protein
MEESILISTKKILGVADDDTSFDLDIITHINSAFSILNDLGIGPTAGFVIDDGTSKWQDFLDPGTKKVQLSKAKTCVFIRSRLLFDPPTSPHHLTAMQEQLKECEWRLNVNREASDWKDPEPFDQLVIDGGDPSGGS